MRLLKRYPILIVGIGLIVLANNILQFAPGQVQTGNMALFIPGFLIALGFLGMFVNKRIAR